MYWAAHIAFSTVLFLAVCVPFPQLFSPLSLLLCAAASILPDIDHKNSKISKFSISALRALIVALCAYIASQQKTLSDMFLLFAFALALLSAALSLFCAFLRPRHRGVTHSILFPLPICAAIFLLFGLHAAAGFLMGYFSHLLGDFTLKFS